MPTLVKSLVDITTPGYGDRSQESTVFDEIKKAIEQEVEMKRVDSVAGWGIPNQDWYEFRAWVHPSFGPMRLDELSDEMNEKFVEAQVRGIVLVYVSYERADGEGYFQTGGPVSKETVVTKEVEEDEERMIGDFPEADPVSEEVEE